MTYTVHMQRDEIIVRLAPEADYVPSLGVHWPAKFLDQRYLDAVNDNKVVQQWRHIFRMDYLTALNPRSVLIPAYIFQYNWAHHGDPSRSTS